MTQSAGTMLEAAEDYLDLRRKLGFQIGIEAAELRRFARFADRIGHRGPITTELAVRWATLPDSSRQYHARRLDVVRRFARHRASHDAATEIPPERLLGSSVHRRQEPHICSATEISKLLKIAAQLGPKNGLRGETYRTLLGLLAATGMRISEALALRRENIDLESGTITIQKTKVYRARIVPLHGTVIEELRQYVRRRDRYHRPRVPDAFFLTERGTSLKYLPVRLTFRKLTRELGWQRGRNGRLPRIHDLRHTFAVRRLIRWYEEEQNIDNKTAALATYLGHTRVTHTYWYLTGVPELLALTARRFERYAAQAVAGDA